MVVRLKLVAENEFGSLAIPDLDKMTVIATTYDNLRALDAVVWIKNRKEEQILKVVIKFTGYEFVSYIPNECLKWFFFLNLTPLDFIFFDTTKLKTPKCDAQLVSLLIGNTTILFLDQGKIRTGDKFELSSHSTVADAGAGKYSLLAQFQHCHVFYIHHRYEHLFYLGHLFVICILSFNEYHRPDWSVIMGKNYILSNH